MTFFLGVCFALSGISYADANLNGELGVDLTNYGFTTDFHDTTRASTINQTMSRHYLNLSLAGPLVNSHFANYSTRLSIFGTYHRAVSDDEDKSQYLNPDLNTYYGQLTMFPERRYPLQLYRIKSHEHKLRYESNNRNKFAIIRPALGVVRRYESKKESNGSLFRADIGKDVKLLAEYRQDNTVALRRYDFGEERDIWVQFSIIKEDTISQYHTVIITNTIPATTIQVRVDYSLVAEILPDSTMSIIIESGNHEIEIQPLTYYNRFLFSFRPPGDMVWKVVYNSPSSPNDLNQTNTTASLNLKYEGEGPFSSEANYEYLDQNESEQKLLTFLNNFSNSAAYRFSKSTSLTMFTSYNKNQSKIDTLKSQTANVLSNTSTFSFVRRGGVALSVVHGFSKNNSNTGYNEISSTLNTFTARMSMPRKTLKYKLDIKNNASLMEDSEDFVNNQYSTEITNSIEYPLLGIKFQPRNQTKYSLNKQKGPDQTSSEIDTKFTLTGEIKRHKLLGNTSFKGEYQYRKKFLGDATNVKERYLFDATVVRKIGDDFRLMLLTTQEYETTGGSNPTAGPNVDQKSSGREGEYKSSYKIDIQAAPFSDFMISGSYMLIGQTGTKIQKFAFLLNMVIPGIRVPFRSFLTEELRDLAGSPLQTQLVSESKVSYRFRQITMVLTHRYARDKLISNTYASHEVNAKISRQFMLF